MLEGNYAAMLSVIIIPHASVSLQRRWHALRPVTFISCIFCSKETVLENALVDATSENTYFIENGSMKMFPSWVIPYDEFLSGKSAEDTNTQIQIMYEWSLLIDLCMVFNKPWKPARLLLSLYQNIGRRKVIKKIFLISHM